MHALHGPAKNNPLTSDPYPPARRGDDADVLHGVTIPDPYRWLEDASSEETEAWAEAEDRLVEEWAKRREPQRRHFADRTRALMPGFVSGPVFRGDNRFHTRRQPEQDHPVLVVNDRVLIDPSDLSPDHTTTLDSWFPSWDGTKLAYVLSEGGTELSVLRVMDVATGEVIDGPIVCGRAVGVAWRGDGFFYVRRLPDDVRPAGEDEFHRRVWWHVVGAPVEDDVMVFGEGRDKTTYYGPSISDDGRWLSVSASLGTAPRNDLYLAEVDDPTALTWIAVQEGVDAQTYGRVAHDGRLYLHTDHRAPRGRIVRADPMSPTDWVELVSESDGVLGNVTITADAVVAVLTRDVTDVIEVHDLETGELRANVSLPGLGSAAVHSRPGGGTDVWISYTDHLTPFRVLHTTVVGGEVGPVETWAEPPGYVPFAGAAVRQVWVESTDGARVPMFVISPPDAHGPRPTVLYGYGGFNNALTPGYSAATASWVEAGGVWVIANLRGGSEFGEEWHRDGMRANKQHVFDDFAACARRLIDDGVTTVEQLGIYGGSNGGLLVGAALTQTPSLYRAVVCSAPLLDMVRYEKFGLGVTWNDEYGTAADPVELGWLLGYSPYHHVVGGVSYPATLFTVFDSDSRVDPLHARKMCAALQAATSGEFADRPVLFRREAKVGHSTRSVTRSIELSADISAFLADQLGL